jgi:hypothetical protein
MSELNSFASFSSASCVTAKEILKNRTLLDLNQILNPQDIQCSVGC